MQRTRGRVHVLWRAFGYALLALGLATPARATCQLNSHSGKIKHVVYIEFDNQHFTRDNPKSPPTSNSNQTCSISSSKTARSMPAIIRF